MNKIQIQITEIENGFLIGIPKQSKLSNQPPSVELIYCDDFDATVAALKSCWPIK